MKLRSQKRILQANRIFTDREEPRAAFWKNYEKCKKNIDGEWEIKVLSYYGIGGIGKSTLVKKLQEELTEKISEPKFVGFDFDHFTDPRCALESLRIKLENSYGFKFPLFSLGFYSYAQKIGEKVSPEAIKGIIDKNPLLGSIMTAVGCLPVVGIGAKLLMAADKGVAIIKKVMEDHKNEIKDIDDKDADELYEYLPVLFAQDLSDNLKNIKEPLVIFLDTYEQLVNEMQGTGESLNKDLWLRGEDGLIHNTSNVLWVIAGREKLKWEKFDSGWSDALEQHRLGNLSFTDADNFLNSAGIGEKNLREGIYKLTQGTPVYLDLCVDRYLSMLERNEEIKIENFGTNADELVERFVRYMDDNKKDIVYALACLMVWDDEMIQMVAPQMVSNFSVTAYEKIKEFSFVSNENGIYAIHKTVGEILRKNCSKIISDAVKKSAPEYVNEQLQMMNVFDIDYGEKIQWLVEFGAANYQDDKELEEFLKNYVKHKMIDLGKSAQWKSVDAMVDILQARCCKNEDGVLFALFLSIKASVLGSKGSYQDAYKLSKQTYDLYRKFFGDDSLDVLYAMHGLANSLDNVGRYDEAIKLMEQVLEKSRKILGEDHPYTISVIQSLTCSLNHLGRYDEALKLGEQVLEKYQKILGEDHFDTLGAMNNLACSLNCLGRYEEALKLGEQVLEKYQKIVGEDHPNTIRVTQTLTCILNGLGRYDETLKLCEQVLEKNCKILGEDHPDTIMAMNNLSVSLDNLGRCDEALKLREQVLEKNCKILGEDHPNTIMTMNNLAVSLNNLGKYDEALKLREQVLEKIAKI